MRTFIFIYLLLLSMLVQEARGIRLVPEKRSNDKDSMDKNLKRANLEIEDSRDGKGSDRSIELSGRSRKLVTKTTSTSTSSTPSKNDKNDHENGNAGPISRQAGHSNNQIIAGNKQQNLAVHSSTMASEQLEHDLERYPDVLDLASMDYSPARRKPPIHN